jgi:hypothetical protein
MSVNVAKFVVESLPGVGVGLVAGAFIPAVLRKVKAAIVKLALKIAAKAEADAKAVEAKVVSGVQTEAKKL